MILKLVDIAILFNLLNINISGYVKNIMIEL